MTFIWTVILVASLIIEAITTDLVSIWFGVGAIVGLLGVFFDVGQTLQVILFAAVSITCIVASRPLAKKYMKTNTIRTNADRVIGEHCLVTETITADIKGEVKVLGNLWGATSLNNETIEIGQYAEVVAIEGSHVVVKKI